MLSLGDGRVLLEGIDDSYLGTKITLITTSRGLEISKGINFFHFLFIDSAQSSRRMLDRWINGVWTIKFGLGKKQRRNLGTGRNMLVSGKDEGKGTWAKGITRWIGICKGYPFDFILLVSSTFPRRMATC